MNFQALLIFFPGSFANELSRKSSREIATLIARNGTFNCILRALICRKALLGSTTYSFLTSALKSGGKNMPFDGFLIGIIENIGKRDGVFLRQQRFFYISCKVVDFCGVIGFLRLPLFPGDRTHVLYY